MILDRCGAISRRKTSLPPPGLEWVTSLTTSFAGPFVVQAAAAIPNARIRLVLSMLCRECYLISPVGHGLSGCLSGRAIARGRSEDRPLPENAHSAIDKCNHENTSIFDGGLAWPGLTTDERRHLTVTNHRVV